MKKTNTKLDWKKAYKKMAEIAGEAVFLADEYAGGESPTATKLNEEFEKLQRLVDTIED